MQKLQGSTSEFGAGNVLPVELLDSEISSVSGGISGYEGAGSIMAVVAFGSLFTPIGPITAGIAIGAAGGLAAAQFLARSFRFGSGRLRKRSLTNPG